VDIRIFLQCSLCTAVTVYPSAGGWRWDAGSDRVSERHHRARITESQEPRCQVHLERVRRQQRSSGGHPGADHHLRVSSQYNDWTVVTHFHLSEGRSCILFRPRRTHSVSGFLLVPVEFRRRSVDTSVCPLVTSLQNDLFCVEWDVKPQLNQSIHLELCPKF